MLTIDHFGPTGIAGAPLAIGLAVALYLNATATHAARPRITDDARIAESKACRLETWPRRRPGQTEYWAVPVCNCTGNPEQAARAAITNPAHARLNIAGGCFE